MTYKQQTNILYSVNIKTTIMWIIYECTEITNPVDDIPYSSTHIYPESFLEYQDLALELSEIFNKHNSLIDKNYSKTINNFRVGIPTLETLNSTPTGMDYQAYSISLDMGKQKIKGFVKNMSK